MINTACPQGVVARLDYLDGLHGRAKAWLLNDRAGSISWELLNLGPSFINSFLLKRYHLTQNEGVNCCRVSSGVIIDSHIAAYTAFDI
jgi:hypothetical protein